MLRDMQGISYAEVLAERDGDAYTYMIESEYGVDIRKKLFYQLAERGWPMIGMEALGMNLEDIFITVVDKSTDDRLSKPGRVARRRTGTKDALEKQVAETMLQEGAEKRAAADATEIEDEESSWEFMKWWASIDTQVRFGREIEALLGSSARYATANMEAFGQLAWSAKDIEVLTEQLNYTVGIREVPGGYYTGRHIANAVRKVINEQTDPRETILDYSITIDEEITKKRSEFGLPVE